MSDERRLLDRLWRVENLRRRAATPGEEAAATRASERLQARIRRVRAADPVARACAQEMHDLVEPPLVAGRGRPCPPESELRTVLARWESGDWSTARAVAWASDCADRCVLPDHPAHPLARVGEVLLAVSGAHLSGVQADDVPAMRRFLRRGDWRAWFDLLERRAQAARRAV